MTRVVLDNALKSKLGNLHESAELCDESGSVIGYFLPASDQAAYRTTGPQISEEELNRRSRQPGGRSLSEIMADLER